MSPALTQPAELSWTPEQPPCTNEFVEEGCEQFTESSGTRADLLDWAESLLCNAVPMSHCSQEDWDAAVKKWRDEKHGLKL